MTLSIASPAQTSHVLNGIINTCICGSTRTIAHDAKGI